jgi:hypothetical protein
VYGLAWPDGLWAIALGASLSIDGRVSMVATSDDALTWIGDQLEPLPFTTLLGAAALAGRGVVAVGTHVEYRTDEQLGLLGRPNGVSYRLPSEPVAWEPAPVQDSLVGADLRGVIATIDRFIAFGGYAATETGLGCGWGCVPGVGIWTSEDGLIWTPALRYPSPDAEPGVVDMRGLVVGRSGLLAHASRYAVASAPQTLLWASTDGSVWTAIEPIGLDDVALSAIVATPAGYLGVARAEGPTVFTSPDAHTWSPVSEKAPSLDGIVTVRGGFVGWDNILVSPTSGVWTSVDGVHWTAVETYTAGDGFYAGAMVSRGDTIIASSSNVDPVPLRVGRLTVTPAP